MPNEQFPPHGSFPIGERGLHKAGERQSFDIALMNAVDEVRGAAGSLGDLAVRLCGDLPPREKPSNGTMAAPGALGHVAALTGDLRDVADAIRDLVRQIDSRI